MQKVIKVDSQIQIKEGEELMLLQKGNSYLFS